MDSDEGDAGRCKTSGRFLKGYSGRRVRRREPKPESHEPMLPHELAAATLKAASKQIEVKDRDGKTRRLPAHEVVMHQLAAAAAKGDKPSMRLFTNAITEAAKTLQAHTQTQFDRLGAYLRSVDEGRPWRLDAAEAAFYQSLADEAGIDVTITPYDADAQPEPISKQEVEAIIADAKVRTLFGSKRGVRDVDMERALVRRVLQLDRARRANGLQP